MARRLHKDVREHVSAHAAARGAEIRQKYGADIGWDKLLQRHLVLTLKAPVFLRAAPGS